MTKKMRILVDIDEVLVDLLTPWCNEHNFRTNNECPIFPENIRHYDTRKWGGDRGTIEDIISEPGWYSENVEPKVDVIDVVERLYDCGHDIIIVSSWPPTYPGQIGEKVDWLHRHFPFLIDTSFIFSKQKSHVVGDVFIDDCPDHIIKMKEDHPNTIIFSPGYAYNQHCASLCQYMSPIGTRLIDFWNHMEAEIHNLAFDESFRLDCPACGSIFVSCPNQGSCPQCGGGSFSLFRRG